MPSPMSDQERAAWESRAVWAGGHGRRARSWFYRLMITPIGDVMRGRLWPGADG